MRATGWAGGGCSVCTQWLWSRVKMCEKWPSHPKYGGNDLRIVHRIYLNTQYVVLDSPQCICHLVQVLTGTEHYLQLGTHKKALETHVRTRQNICCQHVTRKRTKNLLTETNEAKHHLRNWNINFKLQQRKHQQLLLDIIILPSIITSWYSTQRNLINSRINGGAWEESYNKR